MKISCFNTVFLRSRSSLLWSSTWRLALVAPLFCLGLIGCSGTGGTASNPSTTGRIGYAQTSLENQIRRGDTKEAVRLVWGKPDHTATRQTSRGTQEAWTYTEIHNGHGGGHFGLPRGWSHSADGESYDPNTHYPAPYSSQTLGGTPSTEVPVKRVIFENGVVISVETKHQHGRHR